MSKTAYKIKEHDTESSLALVEEMDIKNSDDRSWFRDFLHSIFSSPDMDYSQFERLEAKKTPNQMRIDGLY